MDQNLITGLAGVPRAFGRFFTPPLNQWSLLPPRRLSPDSYHLSGLISTARNRTSAADFPRILARNDCLVDSVAGGTQEPDAQSFSEIGKERGWPPVTRAHFDAMLGPSGALILGDPETVAEKILRVNESLGGISRLTFQMSVAALPHVKLMRAIELLGTQVAPLVRRAIASSTSEALLTTNADHAG